MKTYAAAVFAAIFAGSVSAADAYRDLTRGNPDSYVNAASGSEMSGIQPGVGDSVGRYSGWDDGNPDLFKGDFGDYAGTEDPDIYGALGGNSDLDF